MVFKILHFYYLDFAINLPFEIAKRQIQAKYRQSLFGYFWAVMKPLSLAFVFTFLFSSVSKLEVTDTPYFLFVFCGVIFWELFSKIVNGSTNAVLGNRNLLERTTCPRYLFLLIDCFISFFEFSIGFIIFIILTLFYQSLSFSGILFLPILLFLSLFSALGLGFWLSAICVWFRDVKFVVQYILQLFLLISPIGYYVGEMPEYIKPLLILNPAIPTIELARWALLDVDIANFNLLFLGLGLNFLVFIFGLKFFNSAQQHFADII